MCEGDFFGNIPHPLLAIPANKGFPFRLLTKTDARFTIKTGRSLKICLIDSVDGPPLYAHLLLKSMGTIFYNVNFNWFLDNGVYGEISDFDARFDLGPTNISNWNFLYKLIGINLSFWRGTPDGLSLVFE